MEQVWTTGYIPNNNSFCYQKLIPKLFICLILPIAIISAFIIFAATSALPTPPTATTISPNIGSTSGGTGITITGDNFINDFDFVQFAAGQTQVLAIDTLGNLYTWGLVNDGRLGNGTSSGDPQSTPRRLNFGGVGDFTTETKFKAVAANLSVSIAVDTDGNVYTWGADTNGLLGNGDESTDAILFPRRINIDGNGDFSSNTSIKDISVGTHHILALDTDGAVYAWGQNTYSQLGDGTTDPATAPRKITGYGTITNNTEIVDVSAGQYFSLALDNNGTVHSWGYNSSGRTGIGVAAGNQTTPVVIDLTGAITNTTFIESIETSDAASFAIDNAGHLYAWGNKPQLADAPGAVNATIRSIRITGNTLGDLQTTARIKTIATGSGTIYAIDLDDNLYSWGVFTYGQLGIGEVSANHLTPKMINFAGNGDYSANTKTTVISAGLRNAFAVDTDKRIYSWGEATYWALGNGTNDTRAWSPTEITNFFDPTDNIDITLSTANDAEPAFCFVTNITNTTIACLTTRHTADTTALTIKTPNGTTTEPDAFTFITAFAVNAITPIAVLTTGGDEITLTGRGFENGMSVMLGDANCENVNVISETTLTCTTTPRTAGLTDVIASKSGLVETLERSFTFVAPAVLTSVTPNEGPGDGGTTVDIAGNNLAVESEIVQIVSGGSSFSIAIDNLGNIYSWGIESGGALGNGRTSSTPVQIPTQINIDGNGDFTSKTQIKSISSGWQHTIALDTEGNVYTWGNGGQGALGDGISTGIRAVPKKINIDGNGDFSSNTKIQAIAAGYNHGLAIDTAGVLYAWGRNNYAAIGDGAQGDDASRNSPVRITGNGGAITNEVKIVAIAAGQQQSLAIDENGALYAWGSKSSGSLGTGILVNSAFETKPVRTALTGDMFPCRTIKSIATSGSTSYAIDADNNTYAWGTNTAGQVGNGTTARRASPVKININGNGDFTEATKIKSINTGGTSGHIIAIDIAGDSYSWGEYGDGKLGLGVIAADQRSPARLNFAGNGDFSENTKLVAAGIGRNTSFAIDEDSRIYAWGSSANYALGDGLTSPNQHWSPAEITGLPPEVKPTITFIGDDDNDPATCFFPTVSGGGTNLSCVTSRHAGGPVTIEVAKGNVVTALAGQFTYIVPLSVEFIYPTNGLTTGGTLVTITGSGFDNTTTVMIGDKPCTGRTIRLSGTEISCTTPEHAAGLVNVVISGNGQTAILRNSFLFNNPLRVNSIDPDFGLVDGGTDVTITGSGFAAIGVPIVQISAGTNYALALDDQGNVYAWGLNDYGQLGNNKATDPANSNGVTCSFGANLNLRCPLPVKISGLAGGAFADSPRIVQVSAGTAHSLAVDENGAVYAWGNPANGRLGNGQTTGDFFLPVKISDLPGSILNGVHIVKVVASASQSYAIDNQGTVYAWGSGSNNQLGNGSTGAATTPILITAGAFASNPRIIDISSRSNGALALDSAGNVYAWGINTYGQVGDGTQTSSVSTPVRISGIAGGALENSPRIVAISSGGSSSFAIDEDGLAYAWGRNINGDNVLLGAGLASSEVLLPTIITDVPGSALQSSGPNGAKLVSISSHTTFTLAIDENGDSYAWGSGANGRLGTGLTTKEDLPIKISSNYRDANNAPLATNPVIISIVAGSTFSVAIDNQGGIYTWGLRTNGQTGDDNTSNNKNFPGLISGLVGGAFENLTLSVTFDKGGTQDAPCTITNITDTTISCTTSSHTAAEWVAVTVENRINSVTKDDFFEYQLPFINLAIDGGNTIDLAITPSLLGSITSASKTLIARTNHPTGYYMDISMSTTDNSLRKGTDAIAPVAGSITTPIALTANSWGFALPSLQSNLVTNGFDGTYDPESSNPLSSSVWAPVPSIDTPFKIKATAVPNARTDDPTEIFFGARADLTLPAGVYGGVVVVSVVENL